MVGMCGHLCNVKRCHVAADTCNIWSTAEEQAMVEKYYVSASSGSTYYYIGLEKVGRLWYWPDGASAGNGAPSNSTPYAHW
jgi:hypothetical protein